MTLRLMSAIIPNSTSSVNHTEKKDFLSSRLLESVKQCQIRYGGKRELASEKDSCVADLCGGLEAVLSHGLRTLPLTEDLQNSTLKQVSHLISTRLSLSGNDIHVFWHYVFLHLTSHERQRYALLKHVNTDIGRGRAWIRAALNERSLERYLHFLLESSELLRAYYEDWGFLRDQEKSSMLPTMAAGLNSILFAINIDNPDLNIMPLDNKGFLSGFSTKTEPIIVTRLPEPGEHHKTKRRIAKQVISFDDDENIDDNSSNSCSITEETVRSNAPVENVQPVAVSPPVKEPEKPVIEIKASPKPQLRVTEKSEYILVEVENGLTPVDDDEGEVSVLIPIEPSVEVTGSEELPALELKLDIATGTVDSSENNYTDKINALLKENGALKSQLKRYVSAIKMLKQNGNATQKEQSSDSRPDYHRVANQYELKLSQIAGMHAELMEFNEHLQRQLNYKDSIIQRLRREISQFRGLSPDDAETTGEVSISIPSAFLSGTGSDSYHVYQIYIKAGTDEWNIYRRYAHFHALHTDLKKIDSAVSQFGFPSKKTIGNKDTVVVEHRRKKLQSYLRQVIAHWPELAACSSRAALQQHLAFFREPTNVAASKPVPKSSSLFKSSKTKTNTSGAETHYNGL